MCGFRLFSSNVTNKDSNPDYASARAITSDKRRGKGRGGGRREGRGEPSMSSKSKWGARSAGGKTNGINGQYRELKFEPDPQAYLEVRSSTPRVPAYATSGSSVRCSASDYPPAPPCMTHFNMSRIEWTSEETKITVNGIRVYDCASYALCGYANEPHIYL